MKVRKKNKALKFKKKLFKTTNDLNTELRFKAENKFRRKV